MKYLAWFVGIFAIVLVIIFGSIWLRNTIRNDRATTTVATTVSLSKYDHDGVVLRFMAVGPVVADEDHRELMIDVSSASRVARIIRGYNGSVSKEVNYGNNAKAFTDFITAVDKAGFTNERSSAIKDYVGQCPSGYRYVVSIVDKGEVVSNLWRTSCGTGSAGADMPTVLALFRNQIPDYKVFSGSEAIANVSGQTTSSSGGLGLTL